MGDILDEAIARLGRAAQRHSAALADLNSSVFDATRALDRGEAQNWSTRMTTTNRSEHVERTGNSLADALLNAKAAGASPQQIKVALLRRDAAPSVESAL